MAKGFFDAIKAHFFQKLHVVHNLVTPKSNNTIVLTLLHTFSLFKKLNIEADKLKGLLSQAACHAPPTLDQVAFNQLVTTAILSKGNEKPSSTFVGEVILNLSERAEDTNWNPLPFFYHLDHLPAPADTSTRPQFPHPGNVCPLLDHVSACFHCGFMGHWHTDCPNPSPRPVSPTPFGGGRPRKQSGHHLHCERVSGAVCEAPDSGASIHLSGSSLFAIGFQRIEPFHIFFLTQTHTSVYHRW
ncbi:hypothetical protein O181_014245 [Austropuccinia psidii MF-1]|uniref:CCHC-type domain-containing protein n=1 Tax=Austropuccinia psidii MF-1 TaxID=1389203 RepID=A0A9Q3C0L0_9BASI|nr:hypothetical protein [Austropuccinia psidii MF-1]